MKASAHSLPSFSAYLDKVFDFRSHVDQLSDPRQDPDISPQSVFRARFHAFVFRLPSVQQLQIDLHHSHLQQSIGVDRAFSDDTLRYSLCGFDLDSLETMLVDVNRC
jgi:hypothetical protein